MLPLAEAPETCQVLRDGQLYRINVSDLAEGEEPYVPPAAPRGRPAAAVAAPSAPPAGGWNALTVEQLAAECMARSLKVAKADRKADLVARLEAVAVPPAPAE